MKSFREIIGKLGNQMEAAEKLGCSQQNVSQMAARDSIPPRYWPTITKHLPELSIADLARIAVLRSERAA